MSTLMVQKIASCAKAFLTKVTFEMFFARMGPNVSECQRIILKGLIAIVKRTMYFDFK